MKNPWFFRVWLYGIILPSYVGIKPNQQKDLLLNNQDSMESIPIIFSFLKCLLVVDFGNVASKNPVLMDLMESKSGSKLIVFHGFLLLSPVFLIRIPINKQPGKIPWKKKSTANPSIQRVQEEVAQLLRPLRPTPGEKQLQGAYEASRPGGKVGQHPSIRGKSSNNGFTHPQKNKTASWTFKWFSKNTFLEMGWKFGIISWWIWIWLIFW